MICLEKTDKFIHSVDISFFLKSNSTSISISNRDVGSVSWATSQFEIEIEVEFDFKSIKTFAVLIRLVKKQNTLSSRLVHQ